MSRSESPPGSVLNKTGIVASRVARNPHHAGLVVMRRAGERGTPAAMDLRHRLLDDDLQRSLPRRICTDARSSPPIRHLIADQVLPERV